MAQSNDMNSRLRTILDIFDGALSEREAALKHNVTETEIREWKAFYTASVRQFVEPNKTSAKRIEGVRRIRIASVAAACGVFVLGAIATAAPSVLAECEDNDTFFCFSANTPAKASEINHNFSTAAEWIGGAIGSFDAPNLATAEGVTSIAGGLSVNGDSVVQRLSVDGEATFSDTVTSETVEAKNVNTAALNIGGKPVYKTLAGLAHFPGGQCKSPTASCTIDLSAGGFTEAPVCVLTNQAVDTTGYQENMVITTISSTALQIWEGRILPEDGTTMVVYWICYGR